MMEQMEIMQRPSKNMVRFIKEVIPYIDRSKGERKPDGTVKIFFKQDTPSEVIDLFEQIKDDIPSFS